MPAPEAPAVPAAPPPGTAPPQGYPPYYPYPPFTFGMPPFGGAPPAWPGAALPDPRASSPPAVDPTMTTADFCALYGLDAATEAGLDNLGFQVGDNLKEVEREDYTAAGFKALAWKRVLTAYAKHKKDNKV